MGLDQKCGWGQDHELGEGQVGVFDGGKDREWVEGIKSRAEGIGRAGCKWKTGVGKGSGRNMD